MLKINTLTINHMENPVGITGEICVGLTVESCQRNVLQEAYELQIAKDQNFMELFYASGVVRSEESAHIRIAGEWEDIKKYYLRVRVRAAKEWSGWKTGFFITAYQNLVHWAGNFISAEPECDADKSYGTIIRKSFTVDKTLKNAYFVGTAHGLYRPFVNGCRIGDDEFLPGWTSYHKRLQYQIYDITDKLEAGENAVGVMLGAGWYKGVMGFEHYRNLYGTRTAFGGQIILDYADGERKVIAADTDWKWTKSPVLFSEIYDGEIYDASLEQDGWCERGFDESGWKKTEEVERDIKTLVPQQGNGVQKINRLAPQSVFHTPQGDLVVDFGQNLTGWCEFTVEDAVCGDVVELQLFEILDGDGNVYTANLRKAKQTVRYICKGGGRETFHPNFTFQGFRYVHVMQFPGALKTENITAYALHSRMAETGSFACSNPLLNRLQQNILWGMKGNFLDIPTDCPQRDERLGWTGDAQIFCSTALFLMDAYTFFDKWMQDVAADQRSDGAVPHVVPDILTGKCENNWLCSQGCEGASGWADAAIVIPWNLYLIYGDTKILEKQYHSMKNWIDFMTVHSEKGCLFDYALQLGDWVALDAEEGSFFGATPTKFTCAAYYCYSTALFVKIARILGEKEDFNRYGELYNVLYHSFQSHFIDAEGNLTVQTQTAHILALCFDLVPPCYRENVTKGLVRLLKKEKGHLVTGFLGTPYFLHALSQNGRLKEAYELLLREEYPGWLYQVKKGATTIWEHWDGIKPDGSMWDAGMNSFNHYAYGAVGDWLYRVVGGLRPDEREPGYKHFYIEPQIGGELTYAEVTYKSAYGPINIGWHLAGNLVTLKAEVPVNSSAEFVLRQAKEIKENDGLKFVQEKEGLCASAGSGSYQITFYV